MARIRITGLDVDESDLDPGHAGGITALDEFKVVGARSVVIP